MMDQYAQLETDICGVLPREIKLQICSQTLPKTISLAHKEDRGHCVLWTLCLFALQQPTRLLQAVLQPENLMHFPSCPISIHISKHSSDDGDEDLLPLKAHAKDILGCMCSNLKLQSMFELQSMLSHATIYVTRTSNLGQWLTGEFGQRNSGVEGIWMKTWSFYCIAAINGAALNNPVMHLGCFHYGFNTSGDATAKCK